LTGQEKKIEGPGRRRGTKKDRKDTDDLRLEGKFKDNRWIKSRFTSRLLKYLYTHAHTKTYSILE